METIRISTAQNIDIDYEVAGLGERIVARLIDLAGLIILYIILFVLGLVASIARSQTSFFVILIVFMVIFVFYDLVCELTMNGQTFGKKIMRIKVISLDGSQAAFGQYLLRWLFRMVDFGFVFGWGVVAMISVILTDKHQRVGDMLAKTTLIKINPRTKISDIAFYSSVPESYVPIFHEVLHLSDRDAELIHEVLTGFYQTGNSDLIYAMAAKTQTHIFASIPEGMNELQFLQVVIRDYNYLTSNKNA